MPKNNCEYEVNVNVIFLSLIFCLTFFLCVNVYIFLLFKALITSHQFLPQDKAL